VPNKGLLSAGTHFHRLPGGTTGVQVNGNMGTLGDDTALISGPGEGNLLAFGRDPVSRALVVGSTMGVVVTVTLAGAITGVLALDDGLLSGGTIGSLMATILKYNRFYKKLISFACFVIFKSYIPPVGALDTVTLIGLADDGDVGLSVATSVVRSAGGSGSDGNEGGDQELLKIFNVIFKVYLLIFLFDITSFMLERLMVVEQLISLDSSYSFIY